MKRNAIKYLYQWKASNDRKPLIMLGALQVGKTWLMQEFAKEAYTRSAYINFEDNEMLCWLSAGSITFGHSTSGY